MVKLTNAEFLSLYTGVLLADSFQCVIDACEKVYGFSPYTLTTIKCKEVFEKEINKNRPDLKKALKELGKFEIKKGQGVNEAVNEYIGRFEQITGSKYVEVAELGENAIFGQKEEGDYPQYNDGSSIY